MIIGIGIDVVDEHRLEQQLIRTPRLSERISEHVDAQPKSPSEYAKYFAILEALYKALPDNQKSEILDYRISKDISGRPIIQYRDSTKQNRRDYSLHVSLSDLKLLVVAMVVIEKNTGNNQLL